MNFVPFVPLSVMEREGEFGSFCWCCLLACMKPQGSLITPIHMHRHSICLLPKRTRGIAASSSLLSLLSCWPPHTACCLGIERGRRKLVSLPYPNATRSGKAAAAQKSDKSSHITTRPCTLDACWCESHRWARGEIQRPSCTTVFGRDSSLCDTDKAKEKKKRR